MVRNEKEKRIMSEKQKKLRHGNGGDDTDPRGNIYWNIECR